jgi:hypothetical protein
MPAQARASLVSKAWVEDKEKRWGKKSPVYQSRVLGEFPTESVNTIISLKVCEDAMAREIEQSDKLEKEMAIDVARYGDDETTIAIRQGLKIEEILVLSKRDNVYIANKAERIVRNDKLITSVKVDVIGVGAGVFDILNNSLTKSGIEVIPIDVSERAYDADLYYNKRAEMWFEMAKWLETGSIPNDLDLVSDLTVPQYKFNSRGKYQVQSKEEIKEVLGRSTDRGDAATMVCYDRLGLTMSNLSTSARSLETKDLLRSVGIGAYM